MHHAIPTRKVRMFGFDFLFSHSDLKLLQTNAFLPSRSKRADKADFASSDSFVSCLDVYDKLGDRYMHQIFMTLCLMNTVYEQDLVWLLLSAVGAERTSTCGPEPEHEYKTDEPTGV